MAATRSRSGVDAPRLPTWTPDWRDTPSRSASSSCDQPRAWRSRAIFVERFMAFLRFSNVSAPLYQIARLTSSNSGWNFAQPAVVGPRGCARNGPRRRRGAPNGGSRASESKRGLLRGALAKARDRKKSPRCNANGGPKAAVRFRESVAEIYFSHGKTYCVRPSSSRTAVISFWTLSLIGTPSCAQGGFRTPSRPRCRCARRRAPSWTRAWSA